MEILAEAACKAVADAGLRMQDIDCIATASVGATMWPLPVAEYLSIRPKSVDGTMLGGSSFVTQTMSAPFYRQPDRASLQSSPRA
jgi:hypothetical protein